MKRREGKKKGPGEERGQQKIVARRIELRTFSGNIQCCEREIITIRTRNYVCLRSQETPGEFIRLGY